MGRAEALWPQEPSPRGRFFGTDVAYLGFDQAHQLFGPISAMCSSMTRFLPVTLDRTLRCRAIQECAQHLFLRPDPFLFVLAQLARVIGWFHLSLAPSKLQRFIAVIVPDPVLGE